MSFTYWTTMDEIGIWAVLAMFLGIDSAFLFIEDGSVVSALVFFPFCLLPFGLFWHRRKSRIGRELILDKNGVHLKADGAFSSSIGWSDLEGVEKTKAGLLVSSSKGTTILMPRTMGGLKLQQLQDSITDYMAERSRWIEGERHLVPEPPPLRVLRRRLIWSSSVGAISFTVLGYYSRKLNTGQLEITDLKYGLWPLLLASAVTGIAAIVAFYAWYRLEIRKRPHLWDMTVPCPLTEPPDIEQHRKDHAKSPPRIELERGKTFVYRKYSVSSGQIRFILWGGVPWTMFLLSTPVIGYLDRSQAQPGLTGIIVVTLVAWTIAAVFIIYIAWAAIWLRPYLSKYRLEGDEISVEYKGVTRKYSASIVRDGKLWFGSTYFGGQFEVFGDDKEHFRIDRRYLREYVEGEAFDLR